MPVRIACVDAAKAVLGEGPIWDHRRNCLWWVDIKGNEIRRFDPITRTNLSIKTDHQVTSIGLAKLGQLIVTTRDGVALFDPKSCKFGTIHKPEMDRPQNRFNDAKVDSTGCFWAGTMDDAEVETSGALYRISPDFGSVRVDDGYRVTNGPAFSVNGRIMYHNDSALAITYRFELDAAGNPLRREAFAQFAPRDGFPDGMTVDCDDHLWIAFWDGWCIRRLSPEGEVVDEIDLPVQRPTSCAFGGPKLDRLYVTSARFGLSDAALKKQPEAGGLFEVRLGISGSKSPIFAED